MSNLLSSLEGGVIGVAVGEGAAAAVGPAVEPARQEVWEANPFRVLEPRLLAELVVQALVRYDPAAAQAKRSGYDGNKFRAMVEATFRAPGTAEALELWRRKRIGREQMRHALHKAGLEEQFIGPVMELVGERLDVSVIANAIQQGFLANEGVLPKASPPNPNWTTDDGPIAVPTEQVQLHDAEGKAVTTVEEAAASGISEARLKVEAELAGLPPAEEALLDMWRRGIINGSGYAAGLREGHTKTKWTEALSARFYQLLPAGVVVRLRLKGWIDDGEFHARMKRHGYRETAADDWFHSEGRPATTHQALIGTRRGGTYDNEKTEAADYFKKAVLQSDIRNEWIDILWHGRETFPSAFVLRRLAEDGDITQLQAHDLLYQNGWPEWLATQVSISWASGAGAAADPNAKKAQNQLWTATHSAYVKGETDEATVQGHLSAIGVPGGAQLDILTLWGLERQLVRRQLTPTDIKKAYLKAVENPETGSPWTRNDAFAALLNLGMSDADAETLLEVWTA